MTELRFLTAGHLYVINRLRMMSRVQAKADAFRAIADPTRRAILDRLRAGPANAGTLASDFQSSRPAISRHLRVLREARLVVDTRIGRERVFLALASPEIIDWWVNPGVFDTREWTADVRVGGQGRASGIARGLPYAIEGKFLEVDPPRRLVQTWHMVGAPSTPSTVTYLLEPITGGTRLTVHHSGIGDPDQRSNIGAGL